MEQTRTTGVNYARIFTRYRGKNYESYKRKYMVAPVFGMRELGVDCGLRRQRRGRFLPGWVERAFLRGRKREGEWLAARLLRGGHATSC